MPKKDSRREKGTGTVYKNGDRWIGRLPAGRKPDGKPNYLYCTGKTEAEVRKKLREMVRSGEAAVTDNTTTVERYIRNWLEIYKRGSIKGSSYDRLESTAINQIFPNIGYLQIKSVTSDDLQNLLKKLKSDGYSYSTVKKAYDCLGEVFAHATAKEDIVRNPMLLVNMLKQDNFEKSEIRYFSREEASRIVEECHRTYKTGRPVYPYGDAFILILNTGIRLGEAIGLYKEDWDKENRLLYIRRNAQPVRKREADGTLSGGSTVVFNTTKTYSGERCIPLNDAATEALKRLYADNPNSKHIICTSTGSYVPHDRMERSFHRMLNNIGIEPTGLHSLRHTFASIMFEQHVDVKVVSELLGHSNVQITYNTYIHIIKKWQVAAVKTIEL